jgi:hypothetical protein
MVATRKVVMVTDGNGVAVQGALHPKGTTAIAYTAVAGVNATPLACQVVRLHSTTDCYIKFGDLSTLAAVVGDMFLKANTPEYFTMRGDSRISAIRDSVSGTLYVTEME